jgi:MFS superfamily sulfate permease-like transporter
MNRINNKFNHIIKDIPSGIVVFLVALPLCLGIAMASGAPLFSGIISGILGGIVVGTISNSNVSVSGPAAGLAAIVLSSITTLGDFRIFLVSVILAGVIQIVLGLIKAGSIADYFPMAVVEGMLAAIGLIIIFKQIPHALGYDRDLEGDLSFWEKGGYNTFSSLLESLDYIHLGATITALIGIVILIVWEKIPYLQKNRLIPAALVVVIVGIILNSIFTSSSLEIDKSHLVALPILASWDDLRTTLITPEWSAISSIQVWKVAGTLAIVASLESLLCIEAGDKLDKQKRYTNPNRELIAQGVGNMTSGLLGGLPITSVVVRTSANISAGANSKWSTVIHGTLLLGCIAAIPSILNMIPISSLAAILLVIGYKLANPSKFLHFSNQGRMQFLPFIVTLLAVVFTDLLTGVLIGLSVSILFIHIVHTKNNYYLSKKEIHQSKEFRIKLAEEVSFLNKPAIKTTLAKIPKNAKLTIDASESKYIAEDILEIIYDFRNITSKSKDIDLSLVGFREKYKYSDIDHIAAL